MKAGEFQACKKTVRNKHIIKAKAKNVPCSREQTWDVVIVKHKKFESLCTELPRNSDTEKREGEETLTRGRRRTRRR
jgi:hypothetical protein